MLASGFYTLTLNILILNTLTLQPVYKDQNVCLYLPATVMPHNVVKVIYFFIIFFLYRGLTSRSTIFQSCGDGVINSHLQVTRPLPELQKQV